MPRQRIRLSISRKTERGFKQFAKQLFPQEAFGILIGTAAGTSFIVDAIHLPEDCAEYSTENKVWSQAHWFLDASEQAKEDGLQVIGTVHSHPYRYREQFGSIADRVQSEGDFETLENLGGIVGICTVHELIRKTGAAYLRASIRFWGPTVLVDTKYIGNSHAQN